MPCPTRIVIIAAFTLALTPPIAALPITAPPQDPAMPAAGVRGDSAAIATAERLLEAVGGRAAWSRRTLVVEERGYLRSGEIAELTIARDFQRMARRLERRTPSGTLVEWLAPEGGWISRNGVRRPLDATTLAIEVQGLRQEPYAIYHRLAQRDSALRVELRDQNAILYVYDEAERLLCWFQLDGQHRVIGWGNFFDGGTTLHDYGPFTSKGDANMPAWGAASNGNFRFEYLTARLHTRPVEEP